MADRHTIETYGRAPHNRNIWSTATERQTIETYGRHACPILLSVLQAPFILLLWGDESEGVIMISANYAKSVEIINHHRA